MWAWFRYKWRRLFVVAAIIGPGLITAFADNDAAGVATYSVSAAIFGYRMLSILIPVTLVLAITQEMGARLAIVSQRGLADLIRERYGVRIAVVLFLLLFSVNLIVVIQNLSGIKSALALFGLHSNLFLLTIVTGLFIFVVLSRYSTIERFFLLLIGFYLTYFASALMAKPNWTEAFRSLVIPRGPVSSGYLFTAVAVLGTTVTAWGQFFINSYVKDKRLSVENLKYTRWEVYLGAILTDTFSFFMMVAVAATLFVHNIAITDGASAALSIRPFAGEFAGVLFGIGLLVAGLLGCVIVPLTTAYAFSEFFGYSGSLDEDFRKSRLFYITLLIQLIIGAAVVLLPYVSLFNITLVANFINGLILPIIFYFIYQFANNEHVMGAHRNNKVQNFILVSSGVIITIAALVGAVGQTFGW